MKASEHYEGPGDFADFDIVSREIHDFATWRILATLIPGLPKFPLLAVPVASASIAHRQILPLPIVDMLIRLRESLERNRPVLHAAVQAAQPPQLLPVQPTADADRDTNQRRTEFRAYTASSSSGPGSNGYDIGGSGSGSGSFCGGEWKLDCSSSIQAHLLRDIRLSHKGFRDVNVSFEVQVKPIFQAIEGKTSLGAVDFSTSQTQPSRLALVTNQLVKAISSFSTAFRLNPDGLLCACSDVKLSDKLRLTTWTLLAEGDSANPPPADMSPEEVAADLSVPVDIPPVVLSRIYYNGPRNSFQFTTNTFGRVFTLSWITRIFPFLNIDLGINLSTGVDSQWSNIAYGIRKRWVNNDIVHGEANLHLNGIGHGLFSLSKYFGESLAVTFRRHWTIHNRVEHSAAVRWKPQSGVARGSDVCLQIHSNNASNLLVTVPVFKRCSVTLSATYDRQSSLLWGPSYAFRFGAGLETHLGTL